MYWNADPDRVERQKLGLSKSSVFKAFAGVMGQTMKTMMLRLHRLESFRVYK